MTVGNGLFTFATELTDGSTYDVKVTTQPTTPNQTCTITGGTNSDGTGMIAGAHVTDIIVTCTTNQYDVGVTVSNLDGTLVLQNNGGNNLSITTDGFYNFSTSLADGSGYSVTVSSQPSNPNQICTVSLPSGVISAADVNLSVNCVYVQYNVGVVLTGLATGKSLDIQLNSLETIIVSNNFVVVDFTTPINDGSPYQLSIINQPNSPNQTCHFISSNTTGYNGTISGNDDLIKINCTTNKYDIGVTVSGLGAGAVVLQNNGGDDLSISTDGSYTFNTQLDDLSPYAVTVLTNPTAPNQTCSVAGGDNLDGTGALSGGADLTITVTCTTNKHAVGVTVSGLGAGNVVLQNNGGDDLSISTNGSYNFTTQLDDLSSYAVTVLTNPTAPNQTCSVAGGDNLDGTGALTGGADLTITVSCSTNKYAVGVTVSGLGAGDVVLQNNGGDNLSISTDGSYTFNTQLDDLSSYAATVLTNPTNPNQTCGVAGGDNLDGTGALSGGDDLTITVSCITNQYNVNVQVTGLAGSNTLNFTNGTDSHQSTVDETFTLSTLDDLSPYDVAFTPSLTSPVQTCTASANASGNLAGGNVTVVVTCVTTQFDVNVQVTGLDGSNTLDFINGGNTHHTTADETFILSTLDDLSAYDVTFTSSLTSPVQTCTASANANGNLAGGNVTVVVTCVTTQFNVNVQVTGLDGSNTLDFTNGGNTHHTTADETFTLSSLDDLSAYDVTFTSSLTSPVQTCTSSANSSGNLAGNYVTVVVTCVTTKFDVNVTVTGLAATNTISFSNAGTNINFNADGTQTLANLDDLSPFDVTIMGNQPNTPNQVCSFSNANSGNLAGAVYEVLIDCVTTKYAVGVTVSGLATGNSVVLQNNGGDNLTVNDAVLNNFTTLLDDETAYAITVLTNPTTPNQTCVVDSATASGTLNGASVNISVVCTTNQYTIGVTVLGLAIGNNVVLQNNGGNDLSINSNGVLSNFTTPLDDESTYAVTVLTLPTAPNQACSITGGSNNDGAGLIAGNNVTDIVVTCSINTYFVGGMTTGLFSGNPITLNLGAENLTVDTSTFIFANPLADLTPYNITIATEPTSPSQACSLANSNGTIAGADIDTVEVNCQTRNFSIGGTLTGLHLGGSITLQNNNGDDLQLTSNGSFTFVTSLPDLSSYDVSISNQPNSPIQTCSVSNNSGTLSSADVTDVSIICPYGDDLIFNSGFE